MDMGNSGETQMNITVLIRAAVLLSLLTATVILSPAYSRDYNPAYNDGLLASEAGDYDTAVSKWQPLAQQGDAAAQFNLALMYHRGLGVAHDEARAVSWYQKSAANGYARAQEFLAVAYREGWFGLPRDKAKADYWDQLLESQGL
jgi:hypothetical protein